MKKLTLSLCAAVAMTSAAFAGETYSKESKSVTPPPCPQWYADNEFNLTLSGAYVWTGSDWRDDPRKVHLFDESFGSLEALSNPQHRSLEDTPARGSGEKKQKIRDAI